MVDKEIIQKQKEAPKTLSTTRADIFASDVPDDKRRYIYGIYLAGDGTNDCSVKIERKSKAGSYTTIFEKVYVTKNGNTPLPPSGMSIDKPFLTLYGGENIAGTSSAGTPEITILYWDSDI